MVNTLMSPPQRAALERVTVYDSPPVVCPGCGKGRGKIWQTIDLEEGIVSCSCCGKSLLVRVRSRYVGS